MRPRPLQVRLDDVRTLSAPHAFRPENCYRSSAVEASLPPIGHDLNPGAAVMCPAFTDIVGRQLGELS